MTDTHLTITVFILLLLIASAVAMITKWVPVPYTLALVIVGLITSQLKFLPAVHISPDLILLIFLPALLFEASWNLDLARLRENLVPILWLAFAGVLVSVGIVGSVLHYAAGLDWPTAMLFGAIISATDPISVLALFRKLGAPERLAVIIEGESLFNDGTAVVVFRIISGIAVGVTATTSYSKTALAAIGMFFLSCLGGLIIGAVVGFVASKITTYFDDHLLEITLTTISAYGSFILAETVGVSPVIAVVIAGIVIGNYGRRKSMSANTQIAVDSFWEYAAFVVNSLVFLLIGLEIPLGLLTEHVNVIFWAVLVMLLARAISLYGLLQISNQVSKPISGKWQHVLFWGGLRGSLSIAMVLSLPLTLPGRVQLIAMTFGAVTFSLLIQGLTVSPLLHLLRIEKNN
ncbi:MAG TPA: Na+/H+ antiporter [Pyrinomonadaceae bacterium]|nr:Na+/H+ antiporter [Pyrinomonadaceae bacterium]